MRAMIFIDDAFMDETAAGPSGRAWKAMLSSAVVCDNTIGSGVAETLGSASATL
jgi:hypothetical protein